jgi:hypothetical protein
VTLDDEGHSITLCFWRSTEFSLMRGAPWFKLFAADFLNDPKVDALPLNAQAILLRMWCVLWIEESLPGDVEELARKCKVHSSTMQLHVHKLMQFFMQRPDQTYVSQRMEKEKQRSRLVSEVRTKAAHAKHAKGVTAHAQANAPSGAHADAGANATRGQRTEDRGLEDQNLSSFELESSSNKESVPASRKSSSQNQKPSHEAEKLSELLKGEILKNSPTFRITPAQERKWAVTADRMLRLDGRTPEQIADLIRWAQRDEFWMANVLSMDTLREKFDQLELKCRKDNGSPENSKPRVIVDPGDVLDRQLKEQTRAKGQSI